MFSARKGPFHIVSGEDVTIIAEIKLPFRLVIVIVLAACEAMNFWEVSINFVRRMGFEFDFENRKIGYDDRLLWQHGWNGSITKPMPITPQPNRWHDDGNALWCTPFEPEDDESDYDEDVVWESPGRPDPEFDQGHPQRNAVDVLDQVRQVMQDIDDFDGALPF